VGDNRWSCWCCGIITTSSRNSNSRKDNSSHSSTRNFKFTYRLDKACRDLLREFPHLGVESPLLAGITTLVAAAGVEPDPNRSTGTSIQTRPEASPTPLPPSTSASEALVPTHFHTEAEERKPEKQPPLHPLRRSRRQSYEYRGRRSLFILGRSFIHGRHSRIFSRIRIFCLWRGRRGRR
jgi:hypothetical protein